MGAELLACQSPFSATANPKDAMQQNANNAVTRTNTIHRESKKGDTILLSISLLNVDRFSQFFHRRTQLELCNKLLIRSHLTSDVLLHYLVKCSNKTVHRRTGLLQRETPAFISPDLWPPNSSDLNPVNYKICGVMQDRVYQKKNEGRERVDRATGWGLGRAATERDWRCISTSGADACVPAFGLEEDILSICCDWLHQLRYDTIR